MPLRFSMLESSSDFSMEIVPTKTGCPFVTLSDLFNDCLVSLAFPFQCGRSGRCGRYAVPTVGRDRDNVQLVNFTEFVFLSLQYRPCQTAWCRTEIVLNVMVARVLDSCATFTPSFCLDCLVQTVIETTSQHLTSGKLVDDDNFAVLDDIVSISFRITPFAFNA